MEKETFMFCGEETEKYYINPITKEKQLSNAFIVSDYERLQQEKEDLIKHCENEIFSQKESIELLSNKKYADIHIGAINAYKNILSKLKEVSNE